MPEEKTVKKVFNNISKGKRPSGKPRKRWLDSFKMFRRNWVL
jgi:hypothetical protein